MLLLGEVQTIDHSLTDQSSALRFTGLAPHDLASLPRPAYLPVVLELVDDDVLKKVVILPLATELDLAQVLGFEMDLTFSDRSAAASRLAAGSLAIRCSSHRSRAWKRRTPRLSPSAPRRDLVAVTTLPAAPLGRALALSIPGAAIGLLCVAIVWPLIDLYRSGETILADRQLLVPRLERLAAEVPTLRARLEELQATGTTRDLGLDSASDALASAKLQSRIEQLAAANGVTISSTEAIPAEDRGPYRRVGLRLTVSGKYEAVVKLLVAVEETQPPLVVSNLQIHGLFRAIEVRTNHALDTRFEVYGLRINGATPAQTR